MVDKYEKARRAELLRKKGLRSRPKSIEGVKPRFPNYLVPYACFECRRSVKIPPREQAARCPQCGGELHWMGRAFKPPRRTDLKQWMKVEKLRMAGFLFASFHNFRDAEAYPETLREVADFIERNPDHPMRIRNS